MKISISSVLRKEILGIGIRPETVITMTEWEMIINLLDKAFWNVPDADHQHRVALSTACAHAERIYDLLVKEYFNELNKKAGL